MSNTLKQVAALLECGDFSTAESLCRQLLAIPGEASRARKLLADCLYNQGVSLLFYGNLLDAAEQVFSEAASHNPKHVQCLHNLAVIAEKRGETLRAADYYRRALAADARYLPSLKNLATLLQRCDDLTGAAKAFDKLAALDAADAGMHRLRRILLLRSIIPDRSYPATIRDCIAHALDEFVTQRQPSSCPEKHAAPYFYLSYHGIANTNLHGKIARAHLHTSPSLGWMAPHIVAWGAPGGRIRIGFASANLFDHSIGHTSRGLIEHLDRTHFEVIVIRLGHSPGDEMANAIDAAADRVCTIDCDTLQSARSTIAALRLDILFYQDIGMEPLSYLLAFARLAPIQLTSFGHPDTTGIPNVDYFVSSALYEMEGAADHYTEQLVQLPDAGTLAYYYKPSPPTGPVARSEFGLPDDAHLYFCPQTLFKMHPDMDIVFLSILDRDPLAVIVLIEPGQVHMRQALEKRWRDAGGRNLDRIRFVERMPHADYLRLMSCADVMLDTVHFNGQNTNLEAFALGIPVVTLPGVMQRERHTLGMYKAMGIEDFITCIASDPADYAKKAVEIANSADLRSTLRKLILDRSSILYENISIVRALEKSLIEMVRASEIASRSTPL